MRGKEAGHVGSANAAVGIGEESQRLALARSWRYWERTRRRPQASWPDAQAEARACTSPAHLHRRSVALPHPATPLPSLRPSRSPIPIRRANYRTAGETAKSWESSLTHRAGIRYRHGNLGCVGVGTRVIATATPETRPHVGGGHVHSHPAHALVLCM